MRTGAVILGFLTAAQATSALGQAAASVPSAKVLTVIDEDPIPSNRANGMGGAIGTIADNVDAAFHNPAGIGGLGPVEKGAPWVRKLYFPELSVSANANASKLAATLKTDGASNNAVVGEAAVDSQAGKRQYARADASTGLVVGRTMLVPFNDTQIAAVPRGQGTDLMDVHYRNMSGIGYGFSAQDPQGYLSIGYFGYSATRSDTQGALRYQDLIDTKSRNDAVKADTTSYTGNGNNAGVIWRMGNKGAPTFGLNIKNLGDTRFKSKDSSPDLVVKQDVDAAFSLSPRLGKVGMVNVVVEADKLSDNNTSLVKKYHFGTEMLLGGMGSYARFGVRAGYSYAGPSAGLNLNLGLIGMEASAYYVDLSPDNSRHVELRESATVYVNVAEF